MKISENVVDETFHNSNHVFSMAINSVAVNEFFDLLEWFYMLKTSKDLSI